MVPAATEGLERRSLTTAGSNTTPVAWVSSRTCGPGAATTWWPAPCASCATSSTAARRAPTRTPATAPASSPRFPTRSSARSPGSRCPRRAATPSAWLSCRSISPNGRVPVAQIADLAADEGLTVLGWRDVPVNAAACGAGAREVLPHLAQLFVAGRGGRERPASSTGWPSACASAPSTRPASTSRACRAGRIVYKGMLSAPQVEPFFPDLSDERYESQPRPGPLPVLHQHVPVLAAGAPVPVRRAQRRDQHRAGQQELDARPRGDARLAR